MTADTQIGNYTVNTVYIQTVKNIFNLRIITVNNGDSFIVFKPVCYVFDGIGITVNKNHSSVPAQTLQYLGGVSPAPRGAINVYPVGFHIQRIYRFFKENRNMFKIHSL